MFEYIYPSLIVPLFTNHCIMFKLGKSFVQVASLSRIDSLSNYHKQLCNLFENHQIGRNNYQHHEMVETFVLLSKSQKFP